MAQDRSLTQLRQDADEARNGLTHTIDELRARTTPGRFMDQLVRSAQENPLQAVAIGAGIAYPLLRAARAIPAPVLMIGAGLFLSSTATGKTAARRAMELGADIADRVSDLATKATENAGDHANAGLASVRETASSAAAGLSSGIEAAKDKSSAAAAAIQTTAEQIAARAGDAANNAWARSPTKEQLVSALEQAGDAVAGTIRQNPLLMGSVGAAIGALIASALPSSEAEEKFVGEVSDEIKGRAREAASQGFAVVKDAAVAAFNAAEERAGQEGLNADSLKRNAEDLGRRARKVAKSAIDAAVKPQDENTD
jgi:uncharacterized protein DUF3618